MSTRSAEPGEPTGAECRACVGRSRRQRGFALLLVIWVVGLLAFVAVGLAGDVRSAARLARNHIAAARAAALAEAGVTLAMIGLLDPDPQTRWAADGSAHVVDYGGGRLEITVLDEAGRVDLNMAPSELLASLFSGLGIANAPSLAEAIAERRREFAAQAKAAGTRPGADAPKPQPLVPSALDTGRLPFAAVAELRLVPGMSQQGYERIRPFVTVYSASPKVSPAAAPREVLLAVPGLAPQEVAFYLAARTARAGGVKSELPPLSGAGRYLGDVEFRAATIAVRAAVPGAVFIREAVVGVRDSPVRPLQIIDWRQGIEDDTESGEGIARLP